MFSDGDKMTKERLCDNGHNVKDILFPCCNRSLPIQLGVEGLITCPCGTLYLLSNKHNKNKIEEANNE
jgi:hypothetical protein